VFSLTMAGFAPCYLPVALALLASHSFTCMLVCSFLLLSTFHVISTMHVCVFVLLWAWATIRVHKLLAVVGDEADSQGLPSAHNACMLFGGSVQ